MQIKIGDKVSYMGTDWIVSHMDTDQDGYVGVIVHHASVPNFQSFREEQEYEIPQCFIRISIADNGMRMVA